MKLFSWLTLIILLNSAFSYFTNLPQNVGDDVPAGKLNSLSFAPFRDDQDPILGIFPNEKHLDDDLALMGQVTHNIRTYSSAEGTMPLIPDLARKHGLTMLQGAWLGALKADNDIEIAELIRSANAHPDVVKRVIVGNEVLLRKDLKPEELIEYIRQVKRAVKQPVSYADVWSMYMQYPELIKEVDFITIHILPYWEDEPISVADAPEHIERIYKQVQQEANALAPNKPILIGESGWPSGGKQRGWSIPSVVNEAQFIRALIKVANENGFDYNIVEAFNQPWKAAFEGIIGANWGLYDSSRQQVFPLTGKIYENPNWYKTLAAGMILFLSIIVVFRKILINLSSVRLVSFLVITQVLATLFISQSMTLWLSSYTDFQRLQTLLILSFNVLLVSFMLQRIIAVLNAQTTTSDLSKRLYYCVLAIIVFASYKTTVLALNGRYVTFPILVTQLTVVGLMALALINRFIEKITVGNALTLTALFGYVPRKPSHLKRVSNLLITLSILLLIGETYSFMVSRDFIMAYPSILNRLTKAILFTFTNGQLLVWLASLGVLATPFYVSAIAWENNEKSLTR